MLGDIHGNREALSAVIEDAKTHGVDAYASVGDVVGYNADPGPCIEILAELECVAVRGNHDQYCVVTESDDGMSDIALAAVRWTRRNLRDDHRCFLRELPLSQDIHGFTLVHNSLAAFGNWLYVFDPVDAEDHFYFQKNRVCFHGHTHVPVLFRKRRGVTCREYGQVKLGRGTRYFVNAGSVGQPRDRDPRAAYVLYDMEADTIELRRVPYPIEKAQRAVHAAGLPGFLAMRLSVGV